MYDNIITLIIIISITINGIFFAIANICKMQIAVAKSCGNILSRSVTRRMLDGHF
jgi:hypothetical protein